MNNKIALLRFISVPHSVDYWEDLGVLDAIDMAKLLTDIEWREIQSDWESLNLESQCRIAQILSDVPTTNVIVEMLKSMLSSNSPDIVEASLDSINAIYQQSPASIDTKQLMPVLKDVNTQSKLAELILKSLQSSLDRGDGDA